LSAKVKYWKIYNYRLEELNNNVDTKNANPSGASRAMIVLIPLLIFTSLIEYLWVRIFGGDSNKYTCLIYHNDIPL
jgi:hypothetical protein